MNVNRAECILIYALAPFFFTAAIHAQPLSIDTGVSDQKSIEISLTVKEKKWLQSHPVIRIGVDAEYAPYSFLGIDGNYQGVAPDFLTEIARRLNVRFEIVPKLSWTEILKKSENRSLDAIATAVRTPKRERYLNFTNIYIPTPLVIMTRNDDKSIKRARDLTGKRIALVKGYSSTSKIIREQPAIKRLMVETTLQGLRAVATGKADAHVGVLGVSVFLGSKHGIHNLKIAAPFELILNGQRIGIRKDWPELVSILNKAINAIPESEHIRIMNKWVPADTISQSTQLLNLSDKERRWLSKHKSIRLAIDTNFAPVEFIDDLGNHAGISADYVQLLSQKLGISIQIIPNLTWYQAIEQAKKGNIDLFAAITPTEQRKKYLSFTRPYFRYPIMIFTRDNYPVISGIENLTKKKIAVVRNYVTHDLVQNGYPKLDMLTVNSIVDGLSSVSSGKADAFIGDIATTTYIMRRHNFTNIKIAAPTEFSNVGHSFAVRKEWPELVSIINKTLKAMPPEKHLEISRKWINIKVDQLSRYWVWVAISAVGFMVILIATSALLRLQVRRKTSELSEKNQLLVEENIERKRADKKLGESEHRLGQFFHATFEMVFFHENGMIKDINPATSKMTGYTPEEIIGKNILDFVSNDSKSIVAENVGNAAETSFEANIIIKTGSIMPVEVNASNINLQNQQMRVVSLRDISERKQSEEALRRSYDELEIKVEERTSELSQANMKLKELDQLKSMFIASVSHELRTPLNSIIGFSSMMMQGSFGELGEKYKDYITRINRSGSHLLSLITDIIDISKIESGRIDIEPSEFDAKEVITEALATLYRQADKKGLTITVNVPQGIILNTDKRRLYQCILNYISNAIKYTEQGKIILSIEEAENAITFIVADTGIGIDTVDMPRLFEAFERFKTHLLVKAGGTGLGLYLTGKIASEILQGEVGADSKRGAGSTFWIKIPKTIKV